MTLKDVIGVFLGSGGDEAQPTGPVSPITERPPVETIYGDRDEASPPVQPGPAPAPSPAPPVIIRPRKASGWSTWRINLDAGIPQRIAGQHLGRTSLLVRNLDNVNEITLGPGDDVTVGVHWPVAAGAQTSFDHTDEVWAVCAVTAQLTCLAEYDNEKGGS